MDSSIENELKSDESNMISFSEFIKDRLYFITYKTKVPEDKGNIHYFTANDDFTPDENCEPISRLSLGTISRFLKTLNYKLSNKEFDGKVIVNYSTGSERKRSNAAVFIGVYAIIYLKFSIEEAVEKVLHHTSINSTDSLKTVMTAMDRGFINFLDFSDEDFFSLDEVKLNWIIPGRIILFSGPLESTSRHYLSPRRYLSYFHQVGVRTIIRLSHMRFDANPFVNTDLSHYDLNFTGSVPKDKVWQVFLDITEQSEGAVLVHCREVLGRAACVIGAYLVKHYNLSAIEAIAWVRMCTTECILEAQKTWLKEKEGALRRAGEKLRLKICGDGKILPHHKQGICSQQSNLCKNFDLEKEENTSTSFNVKETTSQIEREMHVVTTDDDNMGVTDKPRLDVHVLT